LGGLGLIWSVLWYIFFRDQPKESKFVSSDELAYIEEHRKLENKHPTIKQFIRFLSQQPQLITAYLAYFCLGYLLSFSVSWWPGFLHQSFHLGLKETGWLLCIPWTCATFAILLGGNLSDTIWKKTGSIQKARFQLIAICQIGCAISFIPLLYTSSLAFSMLSISMGLSFGLMPISPFYALNGDLALDYAGTSQGLMSSSLGVASLMAPALTGYLVQIQGHFHQALMVIIALMLISAFGIIFERKFCRWALINSL
jgi:hypothetical protein